MALVLDIKLMVVLGSAQCVICSYDGMTARIKNLLHDVNYFLRPDHVKSRDSNTSSYLTTAIFSLH